MHLMINKSIRSISHQKCPPLAFSALCCRQEYSTAMTFLSRDRRSSPWAEKMKTRKIEKLWGYKGGKFNGRKQRLQAPAPPAQDPAVTRVGFHPLMWHRRPSGLLQPQRAQSLLLQPSLHSTHRHLHRTQVADCQSRYYMTMPGGWAKTHKVEKD